MKKLLSVLLSVLILVSAVPFASLQAAAETRIYEDVEYTVSCSSAGDWDVKIFIPEEDGIYIFSSSGSLDTLGYIALEKGEAENENIKADGGQDNNFAVTCELKAGTTYYLGSTVLIGATGSYKIKIVRFEVDDGTIHPITLSSSTAVTSRKDKDVKFFSVVPQVSGKYIYLSSGTYDTFGYVFDEYWRQIAYSMTGGSANNFRIELDLQKGHTYYVGYGTNSAETAKFNILLYLQTSISSVSVTESPERTTYIKGIEAKAVSDYIYHVDLSLSGFKFRVNYDNGTYEEKKYTYGIRGLDCNPSQNVGLGENYIRFNYMGVASSFKIMVEESPVKSVTVIQPPEKTVYYSEDAETAINGEKVFNISLYGMVFQVLKKDGTTENFTVSRAYGEDIAYFYFDHLVPMSEMAIGENTFEFTYYDVTASVTVNYSLNSDNWEYRLENGEAILTKYIGTDVNAVIPQTLGGYPVTKIGDSCFEGNTSLRSVKMSNNITSIGAKAFYRCTSLKELTLPESLSEIGLQGLYQLTSLEKLYWNATSLSITRANNTFGYMGENVSGGTEVVFGFSCEVIPADAFYCSSTSYTPNITKITVGENVKRIGNNAFRELKNLQQVEWEATALTTTPGTGNNIWNGAAGDGTFNVHVGEYVESLANNLFFSTSESRAPHLGEFTVENKNTVIFTNTFKIKSEAPPTFYCRYNNDSEVSSVYRYCVENDLPYVLLDSPLDRIILSKAPEKTEYIVGEEFDYTGLTAYAVYEDGSQEDVSESIVVSDFDNTVVGWQSVTLSYTFIDKTASVSFDVLVSEEPLVLDALQLVSPAQKTTFFEGDFFESGGIAVNAVFTNGMVQDVTDYLIISGYNMNEAGTQTVTLSYSYEGVTRELHYNIVVSAVVLTEIRLEQLPEKTSYLVGDSFSADGLLVKAYYNSSKTAEVTAYCEISGYDLSQRGRQSVTVLYNENGVSKTASFEITVSNAVEEIYIATPPEKTQFVLGGEFSAKGMCIKARYENGSETDVTQQATVSGYDMNKLGTQTLTVRFEDDGVVKTATYQITVVAVALERLNLLSEPSAMQYVGEPLHTEGLSVNAVFNNGSVEDVSDKLQFTGFDSTQAGEQTVTAGYTYAGKTLFVNFRVYLNQKSITGLEITARPDKTAYLVGEALDTNGLEVSVLFDNGTKQLLSQQEYTLSGYSSAAAGTKTVTVRYEANGNVYSNHFYVSVTNYEVGIAVNKPAKLSYFYGEEFNRAGMSLVVTMADGSKKTLYSDYSIEGYDKHAVGEQTITVRYTGTVTGEVFTDSFTLTLNNFASVIQAQASKSEYFYGDAFDETSLRVTAVMADGSEKILPRSAFSAAGYNALKPGEQSISLSYCNEKGEILSDSITVTVKNFEQSLKLNTPEKTVYFYGEALQEDTVSAVLTMADGSTKSIDSGVLTLSGFDSLQLGEQQLQAAYQNAKGEVLHDSTLLAVKDYETAIYATVLKPEIFYGENINAQIISVSADLASGATRTLSAEEWKAVGFDATVLGAQSVRIEYISEKNDTLFDEAQVLVKNYELMLEIEACGKTEYSFGEALDTSGLRVLAVMADGSEEELPAEKLTVTGYDANLVGEQTLTVNYTSAKGEVLSADYSVEVNNVGTSIHLTPPEKCIYYYGEALNLTGMSAMLEQLDGTQVQIEASKLAVSGYQPEQLGEQTLIVSYTNEKGEVFKDRFKVTVLNFETALHIIESGTTRFVYGDTFSAQGFAAEAVMADGSRQPVDSAALSFSGYQAQKVGEQTITVRFTNAKDTVLSTTYQINVQNYESSIIMLTAPTKRQYYYGEALDTTGMRALVYMADRSTGYVEAAALSCEGYEPEQLGEQTVTASLVNLKGETISKTFKVTVINFEEAIRVTPPAKKQYFYGDELELIGMRVSAQMADGTEKTLSNAACEVSGYDKTVLGSQEVTASFTGVKGELLTDSFLVEVKNYEIALNVTPPEKTVYEYGEEPDFSGMQAMLSMADGSLVPAAQADLNISAYSSKTLGEQVLSVAFTTAKGAVLEDSFRVEVKDVLRSLTLGGTAKVRFLQHSAFDASGLSVKAVYASGAEKDVSAAALTEGADLSQLGEQRVTVRYSEGGKQAEAAYSIKVYTPEQLADVNEDGFIDIADISEVLAEGVYTKETMTATNASADVNLDGVINVADLNELLLEEHYGKEIQ